MYSCKKQNINAHVISTYEYILTSSYFNIKKLTIPKYLHGIRTIMVDWLHRYSCYADFRIMSYVSKCSFKTYFLFFLFTGFHLTLLRRM